jgi:hypothetical protein
MADVENAKTGKQAFEALLAFAQAQVKYGVATDVEKAFAQLGPNQEMIKTFATLTMADVEYAKKMQKEMPNDP